MYSGFMQPGVFFQEDIFQQLGGEELQGHLWGGSMKMLVIS